MSSEQDNGRPERRSALLGFALSLTLTLAAFGIVASHLGNIATLMVIALLAVLQIGVQLRFFLHLDFSRSRREDLQVILFASLIIALMVGGSIWILWSLHARMMPM